jgi:DNA-binding CsgD family transcriptional regulator
MYEAEASSAERSHLTPIEIEIVLRIVAGKPARQIAAELNITEDQVQHHFLAIFDKTSCDTPTQLAAAWTLWGADPGAHLSRAELRAQIVLLTVERNALRQRLDELHVALRYIG